MRVAGIWLGGALVAFGCGTGGDELFGQGTAATTGSSAAPASASAASSTSAGPGGSGPTSTTGASMGGAGNQGGEGPGPGGGGKGPGVGGGPDDAIGCSDGTREGYKDAAAETKIAACAGGFDVAGVTTPDSQQPQCNRISGNDSSNPTGTGCSVEDLCAKGWHVCHGAEDVAQSAASGGCEPAVAALQEFWLTRQVQDFNGFCIPPPGSNNITGCGTLGGPPNGGCEPLTTRMRNIECIPTLAWYCGNMNGGANEADIVVKVGPEEGGVLCCRN